MSSSTPPPTRPRPTASRIGPGTARVKALAVLADVAKKAQAGPIVAAKSLPGALNARQCLRQTIYRRNDIAAALPDEIFDLEIYH